MSQPTFFPSHPAPLGSTHSAQSCNSCTTGVFLILRSVFGFPLGNAREMDWKTSIH